MGADAGGGVTGSDGMTLVDGTTDDRIAPGAGPALAGVGLRAGVAVVATGAIRLRRVGADSGRGIARANVMTLIRGGARDERAGARSVRLTDVVDGARIAVVARGARVDRDAADPAGTGRLLTGIARRRALARRAAAACPPSESVFRQAGARLAIGVLGTEDAHRALPGRGADVVEPNRRREGAGGPARERLQDAPPGLAGSQHAGEIVQAVRVHAALL